MIYVGLLLLLTHYLISYLVCIYFHASYKQRLSHLGIFVVVVLSGPLTLLSILTIIFITPLKNSDAGLFDGGGAVVILLSFFMFPIVSASLIKFLLMMNWMLKKQ